MPVPPVILTCELIHWSAVHALPESVSVVAAPAVAVPES